MHTDPKFSIVIVSWNGLHYLQEYLPEVVKTKHSSYEIIIADNASTDGTKEWLESTYPEVIHATLDQNYGYCGGNNRALRYCKGEIVIFLNNDAYPEPNWLTAIEEAFDNEQIGSVQPKIKSVREPNMFEYAGAAGGYLDKLGYPFCAGRIFDHLEEDTGQYETQRTIAWASGAAMAIRKELFTKLGGFDENFEFHMEEIDLCWRIWRAGFQVIYEPKSTIFHLGGGSLPMGSPRKVYYNFRNSLYMLTKNVPGALFPKIFLRLKLDGIAAIRGLLSGNVSELFAIFKAHMHYYGNLGRLLKQRKRLNEQFKNTEHNQQPPSYQGWLIVSYFLRGKKYFHEFSPRIKNLSQHAD